jgi:hypothetical protein
MRAFHRRIFEGEEPRPALLVPGMSARVQDALAQRTPVLAGRLPRDADPALLSIGGGGRERALLAAARRAGAPTRLAPFALLAGLLGLLALALAAPDRRRGAWQAGVTLAGAGGALAAVWLGARTLTLEGFDTSWGDAVVTSVWGAFLGDLRAWALGLAGAGIIVAAATARGPASLPDLPAGLRAAAALAAGALLLADPAVALDLAALAAAGLLLYAGAARLLAGRAPAGLAVPALAALAVVVTLASGGPAHVSASDTAELRAAPTRAGVASARAQPKAQPAPSSPRVCFASMQDARAAAETAAIPEGATVRRLADGRVCVRAR